MILMDIDKLVVKAEEECAPIFKQIDETEA